MVRWFFAVLVALFLTSTARAAHIGTITFIQHGCDKITLSATVDSSWTVAPPSSGETYKVERYVGGNTGTALMTYSSSSTIVLTGLQHFTPYDLIVSARVKRYSWFIPSYHIVDEKTQVTDQQCAGYNPLPGQVRLRHELTNGCLFGDPVDGWPVKTWPCWNDPNMLVSLEPVGGADVRIRLVSTGKCLFGNPTSGGPVKSWTCWSDPNMVWTREDVGTNRARFRHKNTGQCMYGSPGSGQPVKNWPCWSDPNMVWDIIP